MSDVSFLLSVSELAKKFGVTAGTIRRWCREGKLSETIRTPGNHRRFDADSYKHLLPEETPRKVIGYARVSGHDQRSDLQTQKKRLEMHGCDEVIEDLGSGLNCKKPEIRKLLGLIWSGQVKELVLIHADRLLRFGKELVFLWCKFFKVKVTILEEEKAGGFETELVRDVITLMTVFSARLYGKRSWKNRKLTTEASA